MPTPAPPSVSFVAPISPRFAEILTPESIAFLVGPQRSPQSSHIPFDLLAETRL
jgi:hypothetical protein